MEKAVREGLLIRDYVNAEISIGKFAELMQLDYEEAREWLHQHGIATSRQFTDPALEQAEAENYGNIAAELGVSAPKPRWRRSVTHHPLLSFREVVPLIAWDNCLRRC